MPTWLEIESNHIAYIEAGSAESPPLLLLHGIMSHKGVWARTMDVLKDRFHCIAIDQLGFGESDKPEDKDYSIAKQAERALQVADHFGFKRFTLMGHSMGGQVAAYLAAKTAPQRVQKLISIAGVVTGELSAWAQNFTRQTVAIGAKIPNLYTASLSLSKRSRAFSYFVFRPWFHDIHGVPYDLWALDRQMAFNREIAFTTPKAWDSLNATDLTPALKDILAPTLVLFGNQDGTVPVKQAHLFKKEFPTADLVLLDQCGHFPMYEKFDEYIQFLQAFLKY